MHTQLFKTKYTLLLTLLLLSTGSFGQEKNDRFLKTMKFNADARQKVFYIANINGNVDIIGQPLDEVKITADKKISQYRRSGNDQAENISVETMERGDTIIVYIKGICPAFGYKQHHEFGINRREWGYKWNNCHDDKTQYRFDFKVYLPNETHVIASTVNNGRVNIEKVDGKVVANNINGSIHLDAISNQTSANTINGDITVSYTKNPTKASRYYSLNGDINAYYIKDLAADVTFKSFNGELFTNIRDMEFMPNLISKTSKGNGVKFKIDEKKSIKFRGGGPQLDFETFNGNVYIKE